MSGDGDRAGEDICGLMGGSMVVGYGLLWHCVLFLRIIKVPVSCASLIIVLTNDEDLTQQWCGHKLKVKISTS